MIHEIPVIPAQAQAWLNVIAAGAAAMAAAAAPPEAEPAPEHKDKEKLEENTGEEQRDFADGIWGAQIPSDEELDDAYARKHADWHPTNSSELEPEPEAAPVPELETTSEPEPVVVRYLREYASKGDIDQVRKIANTLLDQITDIIQIREITDTLLNLVSEDNEEKATAQ